ncbi:MAG: hypothetical protein HY079_11300 [Elusimicrobia bacterium]|nr:hypothetical protein [Elusimicrobiota bacterium]
MTVAALLNLLPGVLALLILGAHFLRQGGIEAFAVCLALPVFVLFHRRRWAVRVFQAALCFGVFVWTSTAIELAQERMAAGRAFLRMALILGGVGLFTAVAVWRAGRPAVTDSYK